MYETLRDEKKHLIELIKKQVKKGKFRLVIKDPERFSLETFAFLYDLDYTITKNSSKNTVTVEWTPQ